MHLKTLFCEGIHRLLQTAKGAHGTKNIKNPYIRISILVLAFLTPFSIKSVLQQSPGKQFHLLALSRILM